MIFSVAALIILVMIPLFFNIIIGNQYLSSFNYIPILLYANSWNVLISLIGGIYIAKKKTKEVAYTTFLSALINIFINFIFIKFIGLYAACISTLVAYFILSIYRIKDCRKYINIRIDNKNIIIFSILFFISSILYIYNNLYLNYINLIIVIIYSLIISKKYLKTVLNLIKKRL